MLQFKKKYTLNERLRESAKIRERYPSRVPIIIDTAGNLETLAKQKFLIPRILTVGQLMFVIRKHMTMHQGTALFLYAKNIHAPVSTFVGTLYDQYHDADQFLYLTVRGENFFG